MLMHMHELGPSSMDVTQLGNCTMCPGKELPCDCCVQPELEQRQGQGKGSPLCNHNREGSLTATPGLQGGRLKDTLWDIQTRTVAHHWCPGQQLQGLLNLPSPPPQAGTEILSMPGGVQVKKAVWDQAT